MSDGDRRSRTGGLEALADLRIIAIEQFGAGPFGSLLLADLGADVIKIEDARAGGDVARYVPPFQQGDHSLFFEAFNRNKRSIGLDLSTDGGREVFHDLVRLSDCVYSNLRGDLPARLGLRYQDLASINPGVVCCSLSGFGTDGPRAADPAYDHVLQALCGWMSLTGEPAGPPTRSGISLVDFCGGFTAAVSILAGIHAARRDGVGTDCDISLFDTAIGLLTYQATWALSAGHTTTRAPNSSHPSIVPFQSFATSDGWIVIACAKEKFWLRLCAAIDRPDLATDGRYLDFASRREHADDLISELAREFAERTTAEWVDLLAAAGVPCAPVNSLGEALGDPQVAARELVVETEHPVLGQVRSVASPPRVGHRLREHRRGPFQAEHANELMTDLLGYSSERIRLLEERGAFGPQAAAAPG